MKFLTYTITLLTGALLLMNTSCKKDEPDVTQPPAPTNEEEVITTLSLVFQDTAFAFPPTTYTFRDPDGDGGAGPDIWDTIRLNSSTSYAVQVILLNETVSPADSISNEVLDEADEHLFCFTPAVPTLLVQRTDSDGTHEIGLQSRWDAGTASNTNVQVVLKHQPDGLKDGNCAPGETDVDVTFQVEIQ